MDGIERADRFTGECLAGAINYLRRDAQQMPMSGSGSEMRTPVSSFPLAQVAYRQGVA
jgi:hypothetical protein